MCIIMGCGVNISCPPRINLKRPTIVSVKKKEHLIILVKYGLFRSAGRLNTVIPIHIFQSIYMQQDISMTGLASIDMDL